MRAEFAGEVAAVGEGVEGLALGQRVMGVARFGAALHVAGRDGGTMARLAEEFANSAQHWAPDQATLEDVFIELTGSKLRE